MGTVVAPSSDVARRYSRANAERFRLELHDLLRIPSVSTDPAHAGDVRRAADWLAVHLGEVGLTGVGVYHTPGHPIVYGEWLGAGDGRSTVLVYGHYDVVPAAREDGWATPPFEPFERDGRIYARGATDDKGQLFIHVKALESYLRTQGGAPVNVKFLLEGEEEVSSPNLRPFLEAHLAMLRADVCVISDSSMPTIDGPAILHSLGSVTDVEVVPEMRAAVVAYEKAWGATPVFTRGGGRIPVVADIWNLMHTPVVMMGYGLDDDGLHGPNEHLSIQMFHRGIETAIVYLEEVAQLRR